ncbi:MAG: hypothetical protein MJE12_11710 [Alphaproteobacteria bacterium]|nr:hypothetical protein [Alphaproteobacteria bacterium]
MRTIFLAVVFVTLVAAGLSMTVKTGTAAELLMFDSKLCEWCDRWREEIGAVYPKTEEGKIAPLKTIDIHQARPRPYEAVQGVVYTPTFVLWHDGREVGRILGYTGEDFFWGLLDELIEDMRKGLYAKPGAPPIDTAPVSGTPVPAAKAPKN